MNAHLLCSRVSPKSWIYSPRTRVKLFPNDGQCTLPENVLPLVSSIYSIIGYRLPPFSTNSPSHFWLIGPEDADGLAEIVGILFCEDTSVILPKGCGDLSFINAIPVI